MKEDFRLADLWEYLVKEKCRKLGYCKELFRLCLVERDSLEGDDLTSLADILMQKHEIIRKLGEIEAHISWILRKLAGFRPEGGGNDERDLGISSEVANIDREISAIMQEVFALEKENKKALAKRSVELGRLARGGKAGSLRAVERQRKEVIHW